MDVTIIFLVCVFSICSVDPLNLNVSEKLTLSGISAGAYFAVQYQVAHSSLVNGVGVVAGGPYYCSQNEGIILALTSCMKDPSLIPIAALAEWMLTFQNTWLIDPLENLLNHDIYVYSGQKDTEVVPGVVDKLVDLYNHFGVKKIKTVMNIPSNHAWITDDYGNDCDYLGVPYINNCHYDMAGDILKTLHDMKHGRVKMVEKNLRKFSQKKYFPVVSFGEIGFAYVPTACANNTLCDLHVSFHGCYQCYDHSGDTYVRHVGLNEWAESNNIIVLYPQAKKSELVPYNPRGCFDWWGYSGIYYATKDGMQIMAVKHIIDDLKEGKLEWL